MATLILRNVLLILCTIGAFHVYGQNQENRDANTHDSEASNQATTEIVLADISIIDAPEGFEVSDKINGYVHQSTGTSIVISEIEKVNYINMGKSMSDEYFARNEITLVTKSELRSDYDARGLVYKTTLTSKGIDYTRYFVFTGSTESTIWLSITHPSEYEPLIEGKILKCIQSINLEKSTDDEN